MPVNYGKCHMQKTYQRHEESSPRDTVEEGYGVLLECSRGGEGRYEMDESGEKQVVERSVEATWFCRGHHFYTSL